MKRTPFAFLPYQSRWVFDPATVKLIEKSRRIGISWATAGGSVLEAASLNGCDQLYIGPTQRMAVEFIEDCADWARRLHHGFGFSVRVLKDGEKSILAYTIRFASGFKIEALSSRPSNLRGRQGHVIIDEAAFHDNLEELLKASMSMKFWGGHVSIISTHNGVLNDFNLLIEDVAAGRVSYSRHRVTLDDALAEGLYRRICLVRGLEWSPEAQEAWRAEVIADHRHHADEELFCIPSESGGTYLGSAIIEGQMFRAPIFRLELQSSFAARPDEYRERFVRDWLQDNLSEALAALPQDNLHTFGMDFGRTADLSVIAPTTIEQDLTRRVPFLVELRGVPYDEQKQILFHVGDNLPRMVKGAIDATGNGGYIAEKAWQRWGGAEDDENGRIVRVNISQKFYADSLPKLRAAFEDGEIWVPKDSDVLLDLRSFQVIDGIPKLPKWRAKSKKDNKPRHGDAGIAILLADFASRLPHERYEYRPIKGSDHKRPIRTARAGTHKRRGFF